MSAEEIQRLILAYCNQVHTLTNHITYITHLLQKSKNCSGYIPKLQRSARKITALLGMILRKKSTTLLQWELARLPKEFAAYIILVSRKEAQKAEQAGSDLLGKLLSLQREVESLFQLKMTKSSVSVMSGPRLR